MVFVDSLTISGTIYDTELEILKKCKNMRYLDLSRAYTTYSPRTIEKKERDRAMAATMIGLIIKLAGITKHVLVLPFSLKATSKEARITFDFKKALENVHYADLKEWADLNLYGNPAMERREIFRKTS